MADTSQSNVTQEYLERMKKEHPERVLDDTYYETPEEYNKAVADKEAKVADLKKKAGKTAEEKIAREQAIDNDINKVLYGPNAQVTNAQLEKSVGGIELNAVIGNAAQVKARQHLLNPNKYESEIKKPNPGKFPNNEDAFPVDQKIEEFEAHKPDCKIHQITTHIHGEAAAKAALFIGDTAEKRLIHLENNMATIMRYLFRLGSRVQINCVYYGGQTPFEKYKCIRCMHDDRISDGQMVQIDQCLACTRYEPVFGQVYEIMNDLGANVAAVLDDNQMGYSEMDDYIDLVRTEKFPTEKEKASFDLSKVLQRDSNDQDFAATWGKGIAMDWTPVAKEDQRTHINWRQSINDDGSHLKRLASFPKDEDEAGAALTGAGGKSNIFKKNYDAMESNSKAELTSWISEGKSAPNDSDRCISDIKSGMITTVKEAIGAQKMDSLAICCIHFLNNKDINSIVTDYADIMGTIETDNPALVISAMGCGINAIAGNKEEGIPALWEWGKPDPNDKDGTSKTQHPLNLDPAKKSEWLWTDFAEALGSNAVKNENADGASFFPKVCYLYISLMKYIRTSQYDSADYAFPFTDDQMKSFNGLQYSGAFGENRGDHVHRGIDLAPGSEFEGAEFHAIHDGVVTSAGDGWGSACNAISISHGDGIFSRYLHCAEVLVQRGQQVSKGDVIGKVGGTGSNGPHTYPIHLHLEVGEGNDPESVSYSTIDPLTIFNDLTGISTGTMLGA